MNDAHSHLVDLKNNHFARANFVLDCLDGKNKLQQLEAIRKKNAGLSDTDYLKNSSVSQQGKNLVESEVTLTRHKKEKMLKTKEVAKTITNQQAKKGQWLWPKQAFSVDGRFMAVVRADVKLPILTVNGEVIAIEQLGEQIMNRKARGQVLAWYGVKLKQGDNHLEIKGIDGRGKMLSLLKGIFKQPSKGVSIQIKPLKKVFVADGGKSTLPLQVTVFDKQGYPAVGDYFLTVKASDGTWLEPDLQDKIPGHQVKISNGQGKIHLRSSRQSGRIKIVVKADALEGEIEVTQKAHLRPLFVTGYLNIEAGSDGSKEGRAKIFMQGKVLKDTHLTLSFDSNKKSDTEHAAFIEEIDDSFYPLKGDASAQGHKARSRNKLFVKLEKNQHIILYGDYQTESFSSVDLAKVRRSLTGVKVNTEFFGNTRVQAHIAEESNRHVVEEFRGNGTASNYQLKNSRLIPHSEIIELLIRDRDNRGIVWYTETLKPMRDYSLDPVTGYLSFHRVIPSLDDKLNPVFIRVSYTQESGGGKYLIAGANIEHKVSEKVMVGASHNIDKHIDNGHRLSGLYLKYDDKEGGKLSVSTAHMSHDKSAESGSAYQIIADKSWSKESRSDLKIARADSDFSNSASGITAGRQEVKLSHTQKI
ncbi:MAG TPA: hypothetical protein EYG71_07400 [Leucothrix sp.]|nr:hypothetical protein [Leucothrix sp.]